MSRRATAGGPITAGVRLGAGGEAEVFAVVEDPTLAFKRYHPHHASVEAQQKLLVMTAHAPADPTQGQGHASIAWPVDVVVSDTGTFEGFVMPRIDTSAAVPLFRIYNPAARQATAPSFTWRYLLRLAANLASALDAVHQAGYVVGDLNESNVLGYGTALVTLVDCDSVQVRDPATGRVFYSPVGKPDYLAPELQGADLSRVERAPASDNFSLAILLHLLLMEGAHPFMGVWRGAGEPPSVPERMRKGMFPPANSHLFGAAPIALPFATLPPDLQRLFLRAFDAGINDPNARPSAGEWQDALAALEVSVVTCSINQSHVYSGHLSDCPWCEQVAAGMGDPYGGGRRGQRALPAQALTAPIGPFARRPVGQSSSQRPAMAPSPAPVPNSGIQGGPSIGSPGARPRLGIPRVAVAGGALVVVAAIAMGLLRDDSPTPRTVSASGTQLQTSTVLSTTMTSATAAPPSLATTVATSPTTAAPTTPPTTRPQVPRSVADTGVFQPADSNRYHTAPATVNGIHYSRALKFYVYPDAPEPAHVSFVLGRKYRRFVSTVGVDDAQPSTLGIRVEVIADGTTLFRKDLLKGEAAMIDVDIAGVFSLKIVVYKNPLGFGPGLGYVSGDAAFGDPQVIE